MFRFQTGTTSRPLQYILGLALVSITALICFFTSALIGYKTVALVLMVEVSLLAMVFDILPVLLAAVFSALSWNYFFIPPVFTFHISSADDALMFALYFIIALVNAVLTFKIRQEEKKSRDREEKEKAIQLYNTLLHSLSHELRTPVATIRGAIDTILEDSEKLSPKNQNELLFQIGHAADRLNRQVENLLNMSRLESGMLQLKSDWCDLNDLIYGVIQKTAAPQFISFHTQENLPLVKLDSGLMEQVLENLLHNALQYTAAGTRVNVTAEYTNGWLTLCIADEGAGVDPDKLPLLFEKFYRLPHTKSGGSGLGLSIVKGFVEAHGGTVLVENKTTGGLHFTIRIPAEATYLNHLNNE
ncbi:MAG: ATP-binding protein [Chitinophagales bacterium]